MRSKTTLLSFFLVFALYLVYGWVLVPLVLPNPTSNNRPSDSVALDDSIRDEIAPFIELLPEGGWERDPAQEIHLMQFGQTIVLFGHDEIEGRMLRLKPCTILMLPSDLQEYHNEDEFQHKIRQSVVIRTPDTTEIEFDKDFDISKMPLPKIETVRLWGKVTVQSSVENSGKMDDFYLETENIAITEEPRLTKIETLRDVRFSFGFHHGVGSGLTLHIAQSDLSQSQAISELNSARFQKLKSLRLVFPENQNVTTIDVLCRGNFVFAANPVEQGWTASFHQDIEMTRNNPNKTVDKLNAETVHLTLKSVDSDGKTGVGAKSERFEPAIFVAQGKAGQNGQPPLPARLSVKQNGDITLVGDEIFYDLRQNMLSLSTRKGAGASPFVEMIVADQYTIRSEYCIQYSLGKDGAFGKFLSEGKGSLIGKVGEETAVKDIFLTWNEMQMEPHPVRHDKIVLKLDKGITANMTGFGTMSADLLELCCGFVPTNQSAATTQIGGKKNNLIFDHVIVKDNVLFETTSGTCRVKQLNIFFTNKSHDGKMLHSLWMPQILLEKPPVPPGRTVAEQPIRQVQYLQPLTPQTMQPIPLYTPPAPTIAAPNNGNRSPNPTPPKGSLETQNLLGIRSSPGGEKFDMTGDLMKMQVVIQNGQSTAEIVAFEGNVRLKENAASTAPNSAVEIVGDAVTIWNPADTTTQINITGQTNGRDPLFKGKGIELYSKELNISKADNMFWTPGAGRLIADTSQIKTPGISSGNSNNNKLMVEWNREMKCDGLVLQFIGVPDINGNRVRALYQTQSLWCNEMQMTLNRRVMFFDDQDPVEPKAVRILCVHDVVIRNRQLDAHGKQKSMDEARVAKLQYEVERGYFRAEGPGELSSVFLGSGQGFDKLPSAPNNRNDGETLNFLAVWFQDEMEGTFLGTNKKVEIRGRKVDMVYCPAASWNDKIGIENLAAARQRGYTLECKRLLIEELPNPVDSSQSSMELTASNSAIIEGSGIFGKAQAITYNQAKNLVDMSGNVTIQTTTTNGQQPKQSAEEIRYNIETRSVELIQVKGLNIN